MIPLKPTILVASSQSSVREPIIRFFTHRGFTIFSEFKEIRLLLHLLEQSVDLLILDIDNDVISYMDIIRILNKLKPELPVVVVTESSSEEQLRNLSQLGVFYCGMKPILQDELVKLQEVVDHWKQYKYLKSDEKTSEAFA